MRRGAIAVVLLALCAPGAAQSPEPSIRELRSILDERDVRYNQRFEAQEKAVAAALSAAKEAVSKAEAASEKRFEGVNEFRNTLRDQQTTLITRVEVDAKLKAILDKIETLEVRQNTVTAKLDAISWAWGIVGTIGGLLIGAGGVYLNYRRPTRA